MINIIGLGDTGIKIAEEFAKSDNYEVYKIGHGLSKTKRTREIKKEKNPENYEKNCPPMKHFFKDLEGRSIFIVNGGEPVSLATLRILEHCPLGNDSGLSAARYDNPQRRGQQN